MLTTVKKKLATKRFWPRNFFSQKKLATNRFWPTFGHKAVGHKASYGRMGPLRFVGTIFQ